jgi:transposase InsO family protein
MDLSTSTYYYNPKVSREVRATEESEIRDAIEKVHLKLPKSGYRTMLWYVRRQGYKIGESRLRRIMKENNLQAKIKKKFIKTTNSEHDEKVHPNLLPEMAVDNVNQVWVSDITYVRILTGFVFVAVVMDIFSRKVIGYAISEKIDHQLTLEALQMAIMKRSPKTGVIHHSDRGVQYLCKEYVALLNAYQFHISCSRRGNPYDNAFCESFMKTLKSNEVDLKQYVSIMDVVTNVSKFIDEIYNNERVHSKIGYVTPNEFETLIKSGIDKKQLPTVKL